jgi:hypothetical protein
MQRWQDELTKHPVNTSIKQFLDLTKLEIELDDPLQIAEKTRFEKFSAYFRDIFDSLEPDLAPFDLLNQIFAQLQNNGVPQTVTTLMQTKNGAYYRQLNDQVNSSLSYINQLRSASTGKTVKNADYEATSKNLENFSKQIAKKQKEYLNSFNNIEQKVASVEQKVDQIVIAANSSSKSFDQQLNNWAKDLNEELARSRKELSEFLEPTKISTNDRIEFFLSELEQKISDKQLEFAAKFEDISKDITVKHKKILKFYSLVANDSITGGHKQVADREYSSANSWRRATIGSVICAAIWILYSLFCMTPNIYPEKLFWLQIGKSISLTALLLSFAGYASKQASLHRINETKARSFFLKVQAFDPFIENLPEEKRIEMKQSLSERIFSSDEN